MDQDSAARPDVPAAPADRGAWRWVPSLYFAEGIPLVAVRELGGIMYKRLGISNRDITYYTGWLYLPWVVKPVWSMLVEGLGTRRQWTVAMQWLMAAALAGVALTLDSSEVFRYSLIILAVTAFLSATHDIAADGFYLAALDDHEQAWFVGVRSTAYRVATIVGKGLLVILAGWLESTSGPPRAQVELAANGDSSPAAVATDWDAWELPSASQDDEQRIFVREETLAVSLAGRDKADAKNLIDAAAQWNIDHGFHPAPETSNVATESSEKAGWQTRLEDWLRTTFPPKRTVEGASDHAGDLSIVALRVARPVAEGGNLVVQFDLESGDKSLAVVEGDRFTVTPDNWQAPFLAVVQADPKLDSPTSARFSVRAGNVRWSWKLVYGALAALFAATAAWHSIVLPRPAQDRVHEAALVSYAGLAEPVISFFRKPQIVVLVAFLLLYRLGEAQLQAIASPFMLDARSQGGLGLTTGEVGFAYGTVGIVMLTLGGIVGGFLAARDGLKRWLWPMALSINVPHLAYVYLSYAQPESFLAVNIAVAIEQFGYGFGFTAYLLYCMYIARGEHQTVHYALCTGAMAMGMMVPGMMSGWLEELVGYRHFFLWVMLCALPALAITALIPLDANYGRKERT